METKVGVKNRNVVLLHPEVLFSVGDHFSRVTSQTQGQVKALGALMGEVKNNQIEVKSSFAVPYDVDDEDPSVWYIDTDFVKKFAEKLVKLDKLNSTGSLRIVGWYHEGSRILSTFIDIHELFMDFIDKPIMLLVDKKFKHKGASPAKTFIASTSRKGDKSAGCAPKFSNIPCSFHSDLSEEYAISQLERNQHRDHEEIISKSIQSHKNGLQRIVNALDGIISYIDKVIAGEFSLNQRVFAEIQTLFNLYLNLHNTKVSSLMTSQHNSYMVCLYVSMIAKNVVMLNELLNNRLNLRYETQTSQTADVKETPVKE